jgi:hypothetical protein
LVFADHTHALNDFGDTPGGLLDSFAIPHSDVERHDAFSFGPAYKFICRSMNNRERVIDFVSDMEPANR